MTERKHTAFKTFYETSLGEIVHGDCLDVLTTYDDASVNLIMTSPPFGLVRKKDYGNVEANEYVDWFKPFGAQFSRVLADNGSLVVDIGGAWNRGYPTRSLYHFKLLIMLCEEFGFHLAQGILLVGILPSFPRLPNGSQCVASAFQGCHQHRVVVVQDTLGLRQVTAASFNHIARVCRIC